MPVRFVAVDPDHGVFVGHAMGLAFFSLMECAGQWEVPTFESPQDAAKLLVLDFKLPNRMFYVAVEVATGKEFANAHALRRAGLGDYIGALEQNFINAPPEGSA